MAMLGYPVSFYVTWRLFLLRSWPPSGGVFFTYFTGLVNPHSLSLTTNVETLLAGILGGIQTLFGAILGTAILKVLDLVLSGITHRYLLVMGILFLVVIMFAPQGAAGALTRLWDSVVSRMSGGGGPGKGRSQ